MTDESMAAYPEDLVKKAMLRMLPEMAGRLSSIANNIRKSDKEERPEEIEDFLRDFLAVHEEISHVLRVYAKAHYLAKKLDETGR